MTEKYISTLGNCSDVLRNSLVDDGLELDRKLAELNLSTRRLTLLIANPSNNTGKDYLYKVKCLMDLIESKILVFKAEQMERMKELEFAERTCYQDIKMMEERISKADYNSLDSTTSSTSNLKTFSHDAHFSFDKNASGLLPAVVDFQKFVAKFGHENGWDPLNHAAFIKLRKKYGSGVEALYEACQERLLHVTHQMAVDHDEWYSVYEEKFFANKAAIQKWKSQKTSTERQPQVIEEVKNKETSQDDLRTQKLREFRKFELALWKREQCRQKAECEEMERVEEERRAARQKKILLDRKKEKKEKEIQAAVDQQSRVDAADTSKKPSAKDRKNNNLLVLALQKEREEQVLKKRKELLMKKKILELEKERRLQKLKEKVHVSVARDPERLLKPTKGSLQKSTSEETLSDSKNNSMINLQRRAIPLWRSEIN